MTRTLFTLVLALPLFLHAQVEEILISLPLPVKKNYIDNYRVDQTSWSTTSKRLYKKYLIASAIDHHQTKRLKKCIEEFTCNLKEGNPLFKTNPDRQRVLLTKIFAGWYIKNSIDYMDDEFRIKYLRFINTMQWSVVVHNEYLFNTERHEVSLEFKYKLFE